MLEVFNQLGEETVFKWTENDNESYKEYVRATEAIQEWMNAKGGAEHQQQQQQHGHHDGHGHPPSPRAAAAAAADAHGKGVVANLPEIVVRITDLKEQMNMEKAKAEQEMENLYQDVPTEVGKNEL
jgi:hypothetical protein